MTRRFEAKLHWVTVIWRMTIGAYPAAQGRSDHDAVLHVITMECMG